MENTQFEEIKEIIADYASTTKHRFEVLEEEVKSHKPQDKSALFAALAKCQGEILSAKKDAQNIQFKRSYATLDSVIDASRDALAKNGLSCLQMVDTVDGELSVTTIIAHESGQQISSCFTIKKELLAHLADSAKGSRNVMQTIGTAITYVKRYMRASVLGIASEDDDDAASLTSQPQAYSAQGVSVEDQKSIDDLLAKVSDDFKIKLTKAISSNDFKSLSRAQYNFAFSELTKEVSRAKKT